MAATFPRNFPHNLPRNHLEAKLELTFPYSCGGRVAAEFDAQVAVGLEDGVLIVGEVELYGYDDDHNGAYEICYDTGLAKGVRSFILSNSKETARAREILHLSEDASGSSPRQKASKYLVPHNSSQPRSAFGGFVQSYGQCHTLLTPQKT